MCLGLLAVLGQSARADDLLALYRQALAHDARWAAAQHASAAGGEKLAQGRAALLPTLSATGSKLYYDAEIEYQGSTPFVGGDREYDTLEYGANLTQPLYRKPNIALYFQSRAQAMLAEIQLAAARADLAMRVTQTYFDALFAQDNLSLAIAQKSAFEKEHEQAQARLAAGAAAITDVHETRSRLDLAVAQELAAQNDLEVKRQTLTRLTGLPPAELRPLQAEFEPPRPEPGDLDSWLARTRESSHQVRAQQRALEIAEREVEKVRGSHYPAVDLVAGYTVNNASGSIYTNAESEIKSKSAGVQVQVPLFQGGATLSREREAVALREKAREELTDAQRLAALQSRQAFLAVTHGLAQIRAMQQAVASSESFLDAARVSARAGLKTRTDVLNAEQQLFTARRDLARARYTHLVGLLQLKAVAGVLDEEDLVSVNALLVSP